MEKKLKFIENDGALFKGPARGVPLEVWNPVKLAFEPYKDAGKPKPVEWGNIIDEAEANEMMSEDRAKGGAKSPA